jgi:hypothetical protein
MQLNPNQTEKENLTLLDLNCPDCMGSVWPDMDEDDCLVCCNCSSVWERP